MNQVMLVGRLGKDPEVKYTQNGKAVCNFSMATNNPKGNKPDWHNIIVWEKQAEACAQYLSKGSQVAVMGKLQTRSWEDQQGVTKYATEVVAFQCEFMQGPKDGGQQQQRPQQPQESDDDIPF
jgi:single-strand DNA-binding protein